MKDLITIKEIALRGSKLYKHYDIFNHVNKIHDMLVKHKILDRQRSCFVSCDKVWYTINDTYREFFEGHYDIQTRTLHYDVPAAVAIVTLCAEYERESYSKLSNDTVIRILGKLNQTKANRLKNGGGMKTVKGIKMLSIREIIRNNFSENTNTHLINMVDCLLENNILERREYKFSTRKVYCYSVTKEMEDVLKGHYYAQKKMFLGVEDNQTLYYDDFISDFFVSLYKSSQIYDKEQLSIMKPSILASVAIKYVPKMYDNIK